MLVKQAVKNKHLKKPLNSLDMASVVQRKEHLLFESLLEFSVFSYIP